MFQKKKSFHHVWRENVQRECAPTSLFVLQLFSLIPLFLSSAHLARQSLLLGMEEDRKRDRRLEMDLLLQEQQTKERLAFQRVLKEAETRIIEEEHAKVRVRERECE